MFVFAPTSSLHYAPYQHRPQYFTRATVSPRDRYLAALVDARRVEAEYVAGLAQEEAAERQRVERARLSRERDEALRRQFLFDSLSDQSSGYLMADSYALSANFSPFLSFYDAESLARELRHAAFHRQRQEQEEKARRLVILRLQQEQQERIRYARQQQELQERIRVAAVLKQREEQARQCGLHRQKEVGLKRKEAVRKEREEIENLFRVLLGKPFDQAKDSAQVKLQAELESPSTSKPQAARKPEGCACHARMCKPAGSKPASKPSESLQSKAAPQPATQSLKAELEKRLGNEYEIEVRDTIQAILASLFHPQPAVSTPARTTSKAADAADTKGKGKAVSFDIPPTAPTYKDIANSLAQIGNIEASFRALESDFVFPRNLDFTPPASPTSSDVESTTKLAYTSHNAPIHNYTHALSVLLTQLDAVESFGSVDVRHRRKEVVDRVEGALEGVEKVVEEKGQLSRRSSREIPIDVKVVTEENEKKASAKEFVASAAFTGSSNVAEDAATSFFNDTPVPEQVVGNDNSVAMVEGYSVTDDEAILESSSPITEVAAQPDQNIGHSVVLEAQAGASEKSGEQVAIVSEQIESSTSDIVELPTEDEGARDVGVSAPAPSEESTVQPPQTSSTFSDNSEPSSEQADAFLLASASSPEFPPRRPNAAEDDTVVVDEGSDWSEVEA